MFLFLIQATSEQKFILAPITMEMTIFIYFIQPLILENLSSPSLSLSVALLLETNFIMILHMGIFGVLNGFVWNFIGLMIIACEFCQDKNLALLNIVGDVFRSGSEHKTVQLMLVHTHMTHQVVLINHYQPVNYMYSFSKRIKPLINLSHTISAK